MLITFFNLQLIRNGYYINFMTYCSSRYNPRHVNYTYDQDNNILIYTRIFTLNLDKTIDKQF